MGVGQGRGQGRGSRRNQDCDSTQSRENRADRQRAGLFARTPSHLISPQAPSLFADRQTVQNPPGGSLEHVCGCRWGASQSCGTGCTAPGPTGGPLGRPLVWSGVADGHPGPGVPVSYAPRSIQMRNWACGQVVVAQPCQVQAALEDSPKWALPSGAPGHGFPASPRAPSCLPNSPCRDSSQFKATFQPTPS